MAALPITFNPEGRYGQIENKYFTEGFFDNFDAPEEGKKLYTIKQDLLLNNYKSFLLEFYELIGEDFQSETDISADAIPAADSLDEFMEVFSSNVRNNRKPFVYGHSSMFSTLGCECDDYWLFHSGSSNAYLETYST